MTLMVAALSIKVGNPLRKLVLLKLADNASDQGECWPSYQHIADQCEISKRSVMNHIDALCEMGLLKKEFRKGPKGNSSNIYHLDFGSAGNSLPTGANAALPGAGDSLGGAGDSLPPGAGAAPRTYHSFEPVNEPVIEPKTDTPTRVSANKFSDEFESVWKIYPKRAGGNSKQTAWKAWSARIKSGVAPQEIFEGVQRYAKFVAATGKLNTEFVKQGATFFGPAQHYAEPWDLPSQFSGASQHGQISSESVAVRQIREAFERMEQNEGHEFMGGDGPDLRPAVDCEEWRRT